MESDLNMVLTNTRVLQMESLKQACSERDNGQIGLCLRFKWESNWEGNGSCSGSCVGGAGYCFCWGRVVSHFRFRPIFPTAAFAVAASRSNLFKQLLVRNVSHFTVMISLIYTYYRALHMHFLRFILFHCNALLYLLFLAALLSFGYPRNPYSRS